MRAIRHIALQYLCLMVAPSCWASCATPDLEFSVLTAPTLPAFVRARLKAADYDCGIRAVQLKAEEYAAQTDPTGIDNRFVLRNLALDASNDIATPAEIKVALLQAASTTSLESYTRTVSTEVKYDTLLALKVGKNLSDQKSVNAQLDALLLAVRIDRMQTGPERLTNSYEVTSLLPERPGDYLGRLIEIAESTRGDPAAEGFRAAIAYRLSYNFSARENLKTVGATIKRCEDILRLVEALNDVQTDRHWLPSGWQWKPTMEAGYCYRNVARFDESAHLVNESIQIARGIKDDNSRLGQLYSVITELLVIQYDRAEVLKLANEMLATANSLDTPMAKQVREGIPRLIADRLTN
jgi:tetratricopeptide (TPR) repeat protein